MRKTGPDFNPDEYAPVAERIRLFYESHPLGRIETELVTRTPHEVVFKATVYRNATDSLAAATGWAAEREGDGEVNLVACLENTETSAIGRALANLGFTASRRRPSAEEMTKTWRARARLPRRSPWHTDRESSPPLPYPTETALPEKAPSLAAEPLQREANDVVDALALLRSAERFGLRRVRATSLHERLISGAMSTESVHRWMSLLRRWIEKRRIDALEEPYRG